MERLEAVLSPWQAEVMRFVWEAGETDSRRAYEYLQGTEHGMSRGSVIFFRARAVDIHARAGIKKADD